MDSAEFESEHELPSIVSPSDAEIRMCLAEVLDEPIREGRRIRCLQHVSFAYKTRDPLICLQNQGS